MLDLIWYEFIPGILVVLFWFSYGGLLLAILLRGLWGIRELKTREEVALFFVAAALWPLVVALFVLALLISLVASLRDMD